MKITKKGAGLLLTCGLSLFSVAAAPQASAQPAMPKLPPAPAVPNFQPPRELDVTSLVKDSSVTDQPNKNNPANYVSFGDSMAANPTDLDVVVNGAINKGAPIKWPTINGNRCAQDPNNFARQVARKTGLKLSDYSCAGLTAYTKGSPLVPGKRTDIAFYVDQAIRAGDLNGNTRLVTMLIGFNEFYQKGHWNMTPQQRAAAFRNAMVPTMNKIKKAAPNAKIQLLGYPDETDGRNNTCGSNLLGVQTHWYFPFIGYFQDNLYNDQKKVARETGVTYMPFKDEINVKRGNSGCLKYGPRLNSTFFDDASHNFAIHLTDNGHNYYARRIVEQYNR